MILFENHELNSIANEIRDEIELIGKSMETMLGNPHDVDTVVAESIWKNAYSKPVSYSQEIFNRNYPKLVRIKEIVGVNDKTYQSLTYGVAGTIISIIEIGIGNANLITSAHDFRRYRRTNEMSDYLILVDQSASFLEQLNKLDLPIILKNRIVTQQSLIKSIKRRFNPLFDFIRF
jgi:hypothetical protein